MATVVLGNDISYGERDGGAEKPSFLGAHTCNKGQDCEIWEFKNNYRMSIQFFLNQFLTARRFSLILQKY